MKPLPTRTRNLFFIGGTTLFFLCTPLVVLYSFGFRFNTTNQIVHQTGGIFVHAWTVNGDYLLNGNNMGSSTILDRSQLFQGLTPGIYTLEMVRDGYTSWKKTLQVEKERVIEINPFILPFEPAITEIPKTITDTKTEIKKTNPLYTEIAILFGDKEALKSEVVASLEPLTPTWEAYIERHKMALYKDGDTIYANWLGDREVVPPYFCSAPLNCSMVIPIFSPLGPEQVFDFYPGRNDILITNLTDGIYAIELDTRDHQNRSLIYSGDLLSFKIKNGEKFYVKKADHYYEIGLE